MANNVLVYRKLSSRIETAALPIGWLAKAGIPAKLRIPITRFWHWLSIQVMERNQRRKSSDNERIRERIRKKAASIKVLLDELGVAADSDLRPENASGPPGNGRSIAGLGTPHLPVELDNPQLKVRASSRSDLLSNPAQIRIAGTLYYRREVALLNDADLTDAQLEAAKLRWEYGVSVAKIAGFLNIDRKSVMDRLDGAAKKINEQKSFQRRRRHNDQT
jgi:hypothetical protein